MDEILTKIATCTERGKINKTAAYPPDLKGQDGVFELTEQALAKGISGSDILTQGFMIGMDRIGAKYSRNEAFVPELLMAAKAMKSGMALLQPFFDSGEVKRLGTFVIGTVQGDLHDIGKNLVKMVLEGGGWEVIDLGVDVSSDKFIQTVEQNPQCYVGLSAMLTTTMVNMEKIVNTLKDRTPKIPILVGGAPLSKEFSDKIGADAYSPNPQGALDYLRQRV